MTAKVVEAVFFARYTASNFRAVYGRLPTDEESTYTKDFLQVAQAGGDILGATLGAPREEGKSTEIEYRWPTGSCSGKIEYHGVRWVLKWLTNDKPKPWTVGAAGASPEISIEGDATLRRPSEADKVYEQIMASGIEPWLVAVKLVGEPRTLHVRTYFRAPKPAFADRSLAALPSLVRGAIDALPPKEGSGTTRLPAVTRLHDSDPPRAPKIVAAVLRALESDSNVLLVGPPGTGKSVALEDLRRHYETPPAGTVFFDPSRWGSDAWSISAAEGRTISLVFHPSYSYENFVAGLYPKSAAGGGIDLVAKPGPLLQLAHWTNAKDRRSLLILDEFNRGQAAAIFGDTLGLLDKDKRRTQESSGAHILRPHQDQPMPVPPTYRRVATSTEDVDAEICLPGTLHIVAAMNSTDRSVAPLDAAMRRRFAIIYVGPDYEALEARLGIDAGTADQPLPTSDDINVWSLSDVARLGANVLRAVNARIEYCLGRDFLLGHALLWNVQGATAQERIASLARAFDTKVASTLRMTFVDQDDTLAAVLGVPDGMQISPAEDVPKGVVGYWRTAPKALETMLPRRLALRELSEAAPEDQVKSLRSVLAG